MEKKKAATLNEKLASNSKKGLKSNSDQTVNNKQSSKMRRKKNSIVPWLLVALMCLLGIAAYQWFNTNKLNRSYQKQKLEFAEVQKAAELLDKDYESAVESLEEMRGDNIELNELIESQKTDLLAQKKKIKGLIWTKRELKKAKAEIQNLTSLKHQYLGEINQLKASIRALNKDNLVLKENNNQLNSANTELSNNLNTANTANEKLAYSTEKLGKENKGLSQKVDMANAIKINYLNVQGYKEYNSGKLKKKRRAKNIHILRTCFTTETNMVTSKGQKNFKIRLVDPMGTTIYNESIGSGTITNKISGKKVQYTVSGDVQYDQEDKNACIDYRPSSPLMKGVYLVEMYNNDFLVGKGEFKLK